MEKIKDRRIIEILKITEKENSYTTKDLKIIRNFLKKSDKLLESFSLKENMKINWELQNKENNLSWVDYPCFNKKTSRSTTKNLGYFFETWEEYLKYNPIPSN